MIRFMFCLDMASGLDNEPWEGIWPIKSYDERWWQCRLESGRDSGEVIEDGVKCTDFKDIMLTSMKFGEGEGWLRNNLQIPALSIGMDRWFCCLSRLKTMNENCVWRQRWAQFSACSIWDATGTFKWTCQGDKQDYRSGTQKKDLSWRHKLGSWWYIVIDALGIGETI